MCCQDVTHGRNIQFDALLGDGGYACTGHPAGDDVVEVGQVRVYVQCEAVHCHAATDANADGGDLGVVDPDAGGLVFGRSVNAEFG